MANKTLNITFSTSNVKSYLNAVSAGRVVINPNTGETLNDWLGKQGNVTQLIPAPNVSSFPLLGNPKHLYLDQSTGVLYVFLNNKYVSATADNGGVVVVPTASNRPTVGKANILYVMQDTNEIFRWSDESVSYVPCSPGLGREELSELIDDKVDDALTGIELIQGGTASGSEHA